MSLWVSQYLHMMGLFGGGEEARLEEALDYHHTSNPHNNLKLYEDAIERIDYFKYLGIWFVKKLTLKMFLE